MVAFVLVLFLQKPRYKTPLHSNRLKDTVSLMLKDRPAVRYLILLYTAVSGCTYCLSWLMQPRLKLAGLSPQHMGWVYFVQYSLVTLTMMLGGRRVRGKKGEHDKKIWSWGISLIIGATVISGLTSSLVPVLVCMLLSILGTNMFAVLARSYLHEALPQDFSSRTAELSVMTSILSIYWIILGPLSGMITDSYSVGTALLAVAGISLSGALPAYLAFRKYA